MQPLSIHSQAQSAPPAKTRKSSPPISALVGPRQPENPYSDLLCKALTDEGITLLETPAGASCGSYWKHFWRTRQLPDVFHLQWIEPFFLRRGMIRTFAASLLFLGSLLSLRLAGVQIVWTLHNLCNHRQVSRRIDSLVRKVVFKIASAVIVHSTAAGVEMTRRLKLSKSEAAKLRTVPHASYENFYRPSKDRETIRRELKVGDRLCFGFIGALKSYKGVDDLLLAFSISTRPDACLIVAGKPDSALDAARFQEMAASQPERIHLELQRLSEETLANYLEAIDVVVLPFRRQLTSGSVLLATSRGKALVLPRIESLLENLPSGGYLDFPPGDVTALRRILDLLNPESAQKMGECNRQHAASPSMSWATMAARTAAIYDHVLRREKNPPTKSPVSAPSI